MIITEINCFRRASSKYAVLIPLSSGQWLSPIERQKALDFLLEKS